MNIRELVEKINDNLLQKGISPPQNTLKVLEAMGEEVRKGLESEESCVTILGLGHFVIVPGKEGAQSSIRFRKSPIFIETEKNLGRNGVCHGQIN